MHKFKHNSLLFDFASLIFLTAIVFTRYFGEYALGAVQQSSGIEQQALECPGADALMEYYSRLRIGDDMQGLVYSLAELADAGQAEHFEVYLDIRQHGKKSLLHPKLADYQGPALCFFLPGQSLF